MLDISDENIIDRGDDGMVIGSDDTSIVRFSFNQSDPNMLRDGVDGISVFNESDGQYRVEYWGYVTGYLTVTQEGVKELAEDLFENQTEVPSWKVETGSDGLPDWFPEYNPPEPICCDECETETAAFDIVTPLLDEDAGRYCPDCWDTIQKRL